MIGIAVLAALGSGSALVGGSSNDPGGGPWETRVRISAPRPAISVDPLREGATRVQIPEFGLLGLPGAVYLPVRSIRIAIPDGEGTVRIKLLRSHPERLEGLSLDSPETEEAHWGTAPRRAGPGPASSRKVSAAGRKGFVPPGIPIRMGDVGWLREQRFVEIIYTPVVAPRGGGQALFYGDVEVDVMVDGVAPEALSSDAAPEDPSFEAVYRRTFANYAQGRQLRARGGRLRSGRYWERYQSQTGFPVYKITVSADGIYRLTQPYLLDPNSGLAQGLAGADPRQFKLTNRGIEVPITVQGEGDGVFGSSDWIEFYGQRLDAPETKVNYDFPSFPDIYQYDDYGDRNVYWLSVDNVGTRARIPVRSAPPNGADPLLADFQETLHFEKDNLYQPTGGSDPFLMLPRLNSNSGSVVADPNNCSYNNTGVPNQSPGQYLGPDITNPADPNYCAVCRMSLPSINAGAAQSATLSVRLRGTTDDPNANPDHLAVLEVNDNPALTSVHCWDRNILTTQTKTLTHAQLTSTLDIRLEQPGLAATASTEQLAVDWVEVSYRRLFQAVSGGLRFTIPDATRRIAVASLPTGDPNQVSLYEITATAEPLDRFGGPAVAVPVRVTGGTLAGGGSNWTLTYNNNDDPNSTADRSYVVASTGSGGLRLPDSVVQDTASTLSDPAREADAIVIGDASLMDMSPSSPFMSYWDHRAAADGFAVEIVADSDIYDEFGFGIEHPEALRRFLEYAYVNWKGPTLDPNRPAPSFVTLVGDTTVDPKNILNRTVGPLPSDWANLLPAFIMYQENAILGFYSSDNYIAAFHGTDQFADVHLGRIPIRTAAEADTVFTKLLAYESPPAGAWRGKGLFITDEGKVPGEALEFERITNTIVDGYWQPVPPHSAVKLYYDDPAFNNGSNPTGFRNAMLSNMNSGVALMQYTGHGAFSIFGNDGFWDNDDVDALSPTGGKYFFSINENCLSGGFHFIGDDALSESFLKAPDKGSVAFFAPAGLSFAFIGEAINTEVYGEMFGPGRVRKFGELITSVRSLLNSLGSIVDQQSYTLVGDPTQSFTLPAPAPPSGFSATAGNAQVTLSWSPSTDPNAATLLYRATFPAGPYTLVTPAPVGGTFFVDPNVTNATAYYYQAASKDPEGYLGALTNLNSDCNTFNLPASGPDCVWARPLNPNPPTTPAGPFVYSDGSGVRLTVGWTMSPESDLASFIVRYGTTNGGPYPGEVTVGKTETTADVTGLTEGLTYYLRLSAKNTSGLESSPTAQLTGVPLKFIGEAPPAFIDDVEIFVTPGDATSLTLQWSHPSVDIYGAPTTLASFDIYRSNTPGFIPATANRIAVITNPSITTYKDTGAAAAPGNYYYVVGAKDARGFSSGLGRDLPDGVDDLELSLTGGGSLVRFDWTPVSTDVQGQPTSIAKYALYASGQPVARENVGSMVPLVDNITVNHVEVAVSPVHFYYTLIVVDTRGNKSPF